MFPVPQLLPTERSQWQWRWTTSLPSPVLSTLRVRWSLPCSRRSLTCTVTGHHCVLITTVTTLWFLPNVVVPAAQLLWPQSNCLVFRESHCWYCLTVHVSTNIFLYIVRCLSLLPSWTKRITVYDRRSHFLLPDTSGFWFVKPDYDIALFSLKRKSKVVAIFQVLPLYLLHSILLSLCSITNSLCGFIEILNIEKWLAESSDTDI